MTISLKLSEQAARAVIALRAHPEFRALLDWIAQEQQRHRGMNDDEIVEHLFRQQQGAIQVLSEVLAVEARAVEIMNSLRAQPGAIEHGIRGRILS